MAAVAPIGVPRAECFPVERLRPDLRKRAEDILLKAMDSEALYTLVGGVKPMSSGFVSVTFDTARPYYSRVEHLRQMLAVLRCGEEIAANLHHYAIVRDGKVSLDGVVFNRAALAALIDREQAFFAQWGLTPGADPLEVLMAVEYGKASARFRGYGYLYGYPRHAVDFFVAASESESRDGKFVARDFLNLPTVTRDAGRFVYAVPKGHTPNAADIALRERCAPILAEYRKRRARYITPEKNGIVALLRDWYDDGTGRCSPRNARW